LRFAEYELHNSTDVFGIPVVFLNDFHQLHWLYSVDEDGKTVMNDEYVRTWKNVFVYIMVFWVITPHSLVDDFGRGYLLHLLS
jgi:hypothetical protein